MIYISDSCYFTCCLIQTKAFGEDEYFTKDAYYEDILKGEKSARVLYDVNDEKIIGCSTILMEITYVDYFCLKFRRKITYTW